MEAFNRGPADGRFAAISVELTAMRVCACASSVVCAGAECSRGCLEKNRLSCRGVVCRHQDKETTRQNSGSLGTPQV